MKVLITGISGTIGRGVARRLLLRDYEVIGIDRRPWPDPPVGVQAFAEDVRKRPAEEIFRKHQPDVVVHLATSSSVSRSRDERMRANLNGTKSVVENSARNGVKQIVFVGRHTIYGASSSSPLYHREDDPPLGGAMFPELADLVAADLYAGSALWRYPKMKTAVLRCVYTLGPSRQGTLGRFLSKARTPMVLGFDPLFHFMHEFDVEEAIVAAVESKLRGVYNVAGPQPLPLSVVATRAGSKPVPLLEPVFKLVQGRYGFSSLSEHATRHLKHPIVLDDSAFREATGFTHAYDEMQTIDGFRWTKTEG